MKLLTRWMDKIDWEEYEIEDGVKTGLFFGALFGSFFGGLIVYIIWV